VHCQTFSPTFSGLWQIGQRKFAENVEGNATIKISQKKPLKTQSV
jgi:hypothetical protein